MYANAPAEGFYMRTWSYFLAGVVLAYAHTSRADDPAAASIPLADVRATIERSLPYIEKEGLAWMEAKKCDTCHHVTFMAWSLNAAADRGIGVDAAKLSEWNQWTRDWRSI